jgi:hypothetical protein
MLNKLHIQEEQAAHAQCLALLVEFTTAVRAQKVCLMCGAKIEGERHTHTPDCAIRRADIFIRTRIQDSARSGLKLTELHCSQQGLTSTGANPQKLPDSSPLQRAERYEKKHAQFNSALRKNNVHSLYNSFHGFSKV